MTATSRRRRQPEEKLAVSKEIQEKGSVVETCIYKTKEGQWGSHQEVRVRELRRCRSNDQQIRGVLQQRTHSLSNRVHDAKRDVSEMESA